MIVYKIQNKVNNKIYIGQTTIELEKRIRGHLKKKGCRAIHNALMKYGIENFDISIIATAKTLDELNNLEENYISEYKCISPNGYNLVAGGKNRRASKETRKKMSEAQTDELKYRKSLSSLGENNPFFGKHHSKETKKKLSEINKGKILSEETKRKIGKASKGRSHFLSEKTKKKISESLKGRYVGKDSPMYGKPRSEEVKRKISESLKGRYGGENNPMYEKHHTIEVRKRISKIKKKMWADEKKIKKVEQIKCMLLHKIPCSKIAEAFKVKIYTINNIKYGHCWNYVRIPKDLIFVMDDSLILEGL